ncbi:MULTISPECIES: hypothetical protein [Hyphobacterium]|uniref:STAS/SEC14 domain-containing protein n=1 Tax=Hyphobacterium vulgare TaxID=1736751 RepID=A0ABV6ZZJ6_9PROT
MPNTSFSVERFVFVPPGVFIARLHGSNRFDVSLANAQKLCERFLAGGLNALIIDYLDCTLGHQPHEYRRIAEVFARGMPAGLPFAYVYRPEQAAHIMVMTRTLAAAGLKARGFNDALEAEEWVFAQLGADRTKAGAPRALDSAPADEPPDA